MAESHSAFVGSVPENYDRYLGPMIFEPFAADLVDRLKRLAPARVLEIACGTGIVTERMRSELPPRTEIVASDLNQAMLDVALRKFGERKGLAAMVADATDLPMGDAEFDAVVCQFGCMFFPDKAAALRQFYRVLRPGGHLLFNVWDSLDHNEAGRTADEAVRAHFPDDPPSFYDTPFGFHDRGVIERMMVDAGFRSVVWVDVAKIVESPSAFDAATGFIEGGPVRGEIAARDVNAVAKIRDALAARLRERFGDLPLRTRARAIVFSGQRPPDS